MDFIFFGICWSVFFFIASVIFFMLEGQDDVYKQVLLEELFKFILGDNHE